MASGGRTLTRKRRVLPGLGLASRHALPQPLGVWRQVIDELTADLIRRLDGVGVLWGAAVGGEKSQIDVVNHAASGILLYWVVEF